MPRSNSETPRAPPKRRQKCTCPSSKLLHHIRVFGYQGPMHKSATKRQQTDATLGESNTGRSVGHGNRVAGCRGRAAGPPSAVAASRRFGVPGARPPPPLPSTQTRRRARARSIDHVIARSPHPYADRPCQCITPVYCVRIHSKYFAFKIFCVDRYYITTISQLRNSFR